MKRHLCLLLVVAPSAALAQGAPPPPPPPPPPVATASQMWLGGSAELTFGNSVSGDGGSADLSSTWAIMATFDYQINDLLTFRVMPRYEGGLKPEGASDSASLTDIRAGVTVGKAVSPVMRAYGIGALGYGILSLPEGPPDSASGLTLTFGGGVAYGFSPTMRVVVELAYEKGMQSVSFMGQSADLNLDGLELGVGIQARIGG